jgi:hypothetical protein
MQTRRKRKAVRDGVTSAAVVDPTANSSDGSAAKRLKWEALGRLSQMPTALLAMILTEFLTFNTALTRVLPLSRTLFAAVRAMRFRFLTFPDGLWDCTDPTALCNLLMSYDLRCLQRYGMRVRRFASVCSLRACPWSCAQCDVCAARPSAAAGTAARSRPSVRRRR